MTFQVFMIDLITLDCARETFTAEIHTFVHFQRAHELGEGFVVLIRQQQNFIFTMS